MDQNKPADKPAVFTPQPPWHGIPRPAALQASREYVFEKLGNAPRSKDDINAELLGLDRL